MSFKVYLIINDLGLPSSCDVIENIFLHEEDAKRMLDSFDAQFCDEFRIEQHEVIE